MKKNRVYKSISTISNFLCVKKIYVKGMKYFNSSGIFEKIANQKFLKNNRNFSIKSKRVKDFSR